MNRYIEIIGPACIGKTTIANMLEQRANEEGYHVINSTKRKLSPALFTLSRLKVFKKLFRHIKFSKGGSVINSIKRSVYVLKTPYRKNSNRNHKFVIIDQGPVGAVSSVGIRGEEWSGLSRHLAPDKINWDTTFLFLTISEAEHNRRRNSRKKARSKKQKQGKQSLLEKCKSLLRMNWGATGKESVALEEREDCYAYWKKRLAEDGHNCISVHLDDMQTDEIVNLVLNNSVANLKKDKIAYRYAIE